MTAPNMASLERSLQNCSLTHQQSSSETATVIGVDSPTKSSLEVAGPTLELNSEGALPFYWEQCLDLKTGEIYFINWRTGMKAKEDPRILAVGYSSEDDSSSYDSEGSSSESSPCSSRGPSESRDHPPQKGAVSESSNYDSNSVLVVAGCKRCLMYYMVPKKHSICPKCCCGELLHFDRSENCCSSS